MYIWPFKIKKILDGRLIKYKSRVCTYGGIQQWGFNYWETYYSVVNWISVRAVFTLSIIRELHTKSVDFVMDCTQADVKIEILLDLPICFGNEGAHPR